MNRFIPLAFLSLLALLPLSAQEKASPRPTPPPSPIQEAIDFSGTAEEDYFALARTAVLSGTFREDVWAAAEEVRFSGTAEDDVRLASARILTVDGRINGNLRGVSGAGNILVTTNAVVRGHTVLEGNQRITVKGRFEGNVRLAAPKLVVESEILGDLTVASSDVQLLPGTVVHGNLYTHTDRPLPLPEGVRVEGERISVEPGASDLRETLEGIYWTLKLVQFISALLIGLLLIRLLPRSTGQILDTVFQRRGPAMTVGVLALTLLGTGGYFLLFTVIGTGVGLFLLTVTGLLFYLGKIVVALALGLLLLRQRESLTLGRLALALILGLAVLYTLFSLAYIGTVIYLVASAWGAGAMLIALRNSQRVIKMQLPPELKNSEPDS